MKGKREMTLERVCVCILGGGAGDWVEDNYNENPREKNSIFTSLNFYYTPDRPAIFYLLKIFRDRWPPLSLVCVALGRE